MAFLSISYVTKSAYLSGNTVSWNPENVRHSLSASLLQNQINLNSLLWRRNYDVRYMQTAGHQALPLTVLKGRTQKEIVGLPPRSSSVERTITTGNVHLCLHALRHPGASQLSVGLWGFPKWEAIKGVKR